MLSNCLLEITKWVKNKRETMWLWKSGHTGEHVFSGLSMVLISGLSYILWLFVGIGVHRERLHQELVPWSEWWWLFSVTNTAVCTESLHNIFTEVRTWNNDELRPVRTWLKVYFYIEVTILFYLIDCSHGNDWLEMVFTI